MKLHYYPDTDSLYIELRPGAGSEFREISAGFNVDLNSSGEVVGFDIDNASTRVDLSAVDEEELPIRSHVHT